LNLVIDINPAIIMFISYVLAPIFTVLLLLLLFYIMKKVTPKLLVYVTGERAK